MARFLRGDTDLLVCTTIIESGLDIANCNTILIDRADRFGLADLYQLRGRVGRYHHQAYAYLLLPPMGALPRNARERLTAIRRYTHLGAGFKLALRDLEIRGAGNILGTEQSGHIAAVGFELYCELLKEAVARLEQRPSPRRRPLAVDLDTLVSGHGDGAGRAAAAVPPDYVEAEAVRIDCYRRLHEMQAPEEVDAFAAELRDRFGELPATMHHLLLVTKIRIGAGAAAMNAVTVRDRTVLLETECGLVKDGRGRLPRLHADTAPAQLTELAALIGRCRVCGRTGRVEMRAG